MSTPVSAPSNDAAHASPSTNNFPSFSNLGSTVTPAGAMSSAPTSAPSGSSAGSNMLPNGGAPQVPPLNDQQALQARLLLAQQVLQASQAQAAQAGASGSASGGTDRAALQYTLEKLSNMHGGNKDAMMKQLQAIQSSHAQRIRSTSGGAAATALSPSATTFAAASPITAASPVAATPSSAIAALPGTPSAILNGRQGSLDSAAAASPAQMPTPTAQMPQLPGGLQWDSLTQPQRDFIVQQYKLRAAAMQASDGGAPTPAEPSAPTPTAPTPLPPQTPIQPPSATLTAPSPAVSTPATATSQGPPKTAIAAPTAPPARPGAPAQASQAGQQAARSQPTNQKQQFLQSMSSYYRLSNLQPPPEIFKDDLKAAVRICGVVIELVELFIAVARAGNSSTVMNDPERNFLKKFASAKGLPNPLPEPYQLPRPPGAPADLPDKTTTDPAQALIGVYQAYLYGFELHMGRSRQAQMKAQQMQQQQQQAAAVAATRPPTATADGTAPSPATAVPSTPITAPSPSISMTTPAPTTDTMAPPTLPSSAAGPSSGTPSGALKRKSRDSVLPSAIQTNGSSRPGSSGTSGSAEGKKRKKNGRDGNSTGPSTPATAQPQVPVAADVKVEEPPPPPKRARYKVEYRPLHHPPSQLAGWDERMVSSTFPKNNLLHPTRSVHELQVVDMESVLMGLRSRLPKELGYCLTVLSMLSMPHPEENIPGLPLQYLREIYMEILDLIEEAAFGVEGYDAWLKAQQSEGSEDLRMSFLELDGLGQDKDYSFDLNGFVPGTSERSSKLRARCRTGGSTDVVLAGLNLLRNFSMMPDNQGIMTSVAETFDLLSRICDARLARLPLKGVEQSDKPYSVLELARIRRDCVMILTNLGQHVDLRKCSPESIPSIFQLLSSFLNSGWEALCLNESPFGSSIATRGSRPPSILSINRALEAWSKLSLSDSNREVLGRTIPGEDQLALFRGLIRLFPTSKRGFEALHTQEEYLTFNETLSLSLYSLVFLSNQHTRSLMRSVPGVSQLLSRLVFDTAHGAYDFKSNAFNVLCRRLCETLGVLNGTVSAGGGVESVSFSAGCEGGDGKGWSFTNKTVEKGWLAGQEEKVLRAMMIVGMDMPAFMELDKLCWATGD